MNLETEAGEVLFESSAAVEKEIRRVTLMFFKNVGHMFPNSYLFMKFDKEIWERFMHLTPSDIGAQKII